MLKKILIPVLMLMFVASAANAEDWSGQSPAAEVNGPLGPTSGGTDFSAIAASHMEDDAVMIASTGAVCSGTGLPPPCPPGQTLTYGVSSITHIQALPQGAGSSPNVGILAQGFISDPGAPAGVSYIAADIPLAAFAKSSTLDALAATTNGLAAQQNSLSGAVAGLTGTVSGLSTQVQSLSITTTGLSAQLSSLGGTVTGLAGTVNGLSTQMQTLTAELAQVQQQLAMQDKTLRQGVAMSLAMDGTGTLGPDEHFALSMNWGTFGGQNGVAGSVAFRAADHVTFDGGIGTGFHGGLVGGRAGVRIAW